MRKRFIVKLEAEERAELEQMLAKGRAAARKLLHARILLKADAGPAGPGWDDAAIGAALDVSHDTIERVRRRFVEDGLAAALARRRAAPPRPRKVFGEQEAHLIALACGPAPAGHERWSLRLLAGRMVELEYIESVSHETVRQILKKTSSSRG
jgi:transposase